MKCRYCDREEHGYISYVDCLDAQGAAILKSFEGPSLPIMSWSVPSDPDEWGPWPKAIEFHEGRIVDVKPHDDGVLITLDTGKQYIIRPT